MIFLDDKIRAECWKNLLCKYGVRDSDIRLLNADKMEERENVELIRNLTIANQLSCKILITTSVLDNGVSIHDESVQNIVIVTDSKLSFMQMLGRVRTECGANVTLYFLLRKADEFEKRMRTACEETKEIDELTVGTCKIFSYLCEVWNNPEDKKSKFYRKVLVIKPAEMKIYTEEPKKITIRCGDAGLVVNDFARQKIGNDYIAESRLYSLAVKNPHEVIYEQMKWMGKEPEELEILESAYQDRIRKELVRILCTVKDYSKEQLQEVKKKIIGYIKDLFPEISVQNGTVSQEKLKSICQQCSLVLMQYTTDDRKEHYTIQKK